MFYRRVIGIELGLRFLRIGEGGRSANSFGADSDVLRLPADSSESQRMISRYIEEKGLRGLPAVLGIPAETVFLSLLTPPLGTRQSRKEVVRDHLEGLQSLSGSDTVSDVFPLKVSRKPRQMLVGVARQDTVCALMEPLLAAGVRIVAAIPVSLAWFNFVLEQASRRARLVVLCPADSGMEILVSAGGSLCGVWRLPLHLSDHLEAEAPLHVFGAELEKVWHDHAVSTSEAPEVIWCGEAPLPESVSEALAKVLGTRPISLPEWIAESGQTHRPNTLAYALAQQTLHPEGVQLNLLPFAERERIARRAQLPYWAAAAMLFAAFSVSLSLYELRRSEDVRARLENAQSQWLELQQLQSAGAKLQARNALLTQQVDALRDSAISPLLTRDLLIAIAEAKQPDDWIVRIADAPSYFSDPSMPTSGETQSTAPVPFTFDPHLIIVEGYTLGVDLSSVRTFIETLRKHPRFVEVDLLGDDLVAPARTYDVFHLIPRIHRFVMKVRIREP